MLCYSFRTCKCDFDYFKIAAEIEIRKHKFCVLLRTRVVSALYGIIYVLSLP